MKFRILVIMSTVVLALGLVTAALALAQDPLPSAEQAAAEEAQRELEAAAALEANPGPALRAGAVFTPPTVISAPLFAGVDNRNYFTYLIDPATSDNYQLFNGFQIWGAAYDADNERIFFNHGPTLYEWPLDSLPVSLGQMRSSVTNELLSMVGLAYHDGTLYAVRSLNTSDDPEGIYTIDLATRKATLYIDFIANPTSIDVGGLAVDPVTGTLYGTNDHSSQRGLVQLNLDGSITVIAPYPAGQTDIDGLAIGAGRAYLVTDEPGQSFVYDFAAGAYLDPFDNPWVAGQTFSGAAWLGPAEAPAPGVALTKTVGSDPAVCASTSELTVDYGDEVTYCYEVTNTGNVTLTFHDLDDSALGSLLDGFAYDLGPGATVAVTETVTLTGTTVNTATWTAYNEGPADVVTATATATVTVLTAPEIAVSPAALDVTVTGDQQASETVTISNTGSDALNWTIAFAAADCASTSVLPWVSAAPASGATAPGATSAVTVTFNGTGLPEGETNGVLCVASDDSDEPIVAVPLSLTKLPEETDFFIRLPVIVGSPED